MEKSTKESVVKKVKPLVKHYCPYCGCPTQVVQCTDGTVEECRDISCPWIIDNEQDGRSDVTIRLQEKDDDERS